MPPTNKLHVYPEEQLIPKRRLPPRCPDFRHGLISAKMVVIQNAEHRRKVMWSKTDVISRFKRDAGAVVDKCGPTAQPRAR
jgi:hypothetical protein